ncbi:hypothetical protein [Streptomyces sp. NPDC057545]|nr:hypothetical protein [Streptomyces sp. CB01580]
MERNHPRLATRSAWIDRTSGLPLVGGTVIRLQADHLPGGNGTLLRRNSA